MDYRFPAELQAYVDRMIADGAYADERALILDAVNRHRELELRRQRRHSELQGEIQLGIADIEHGRVAELDLDEIWQEVLAEIEHEARAG